MKPMKSGRANLWVGRATGWREASRHIAQLGHTDTAKFYRVMMRDAATFACWLDKSTAENERILGLIAAQKGVQS